MKKNLKIIKCFTLYEKEVCVVCRSCVKGEKGFVLLQAGFHQDRGYYSNHLVSKKFPICFSCWESFNKDILEDKRDGKRIINSRIKKTIIKRLK